MQGRPVSITDQRRLADEHQCSTYAIDVHRA